MKKLSFIAIFFLALLAAEEIVAQYAYPAAAVRGTSRRTARRVDRRHDALEAPVAAAPAPTTVVVAPAAPVAAAAATTAAVITTLPAGCVPRTVSGVNYNYCNGVYYQPQYQGTQVVYVVVEVQ